MATLTAERALRIWQEKGLLSEEQAERLRSGLADDIAAAGAGRGIVIFSTIGAVLAGLGVMLFIGSNWDSMGPFARGATVLTGYGLVCLCAWLAGLRSLPRVSESLWFLATLMLGGGIFLLAQIFNHSLTYWQGPFLWLVGTLAMAYARQKPAYALLAVPLAVLALGWLGGGSGWFMDDQLEFLISEGGIKAVLPLIGVGLASLGLLSRRVPAWKFMANGLIAWGGLIVAVLLVVTTCYDEAAGWIFTLGFNLKQIVIIACTLALVVAAIAFGNTSTDGRAMLAGVTLFSLLLLIPSNEGPLVGGLLGDNSALFALYVVVVFGLAVASVWIGVRALNRHLINLGVAACSIIILIQYFAWSFEMLPTSGAFIVGGIVLIGLSVVMERTRRTMIARVETPGAG